jgi:hypothetical protein
MPTGVPISTLTQYAEDKFSLQNIIWETEKMMDTAQSWAVMFNEA